MKPAPKRIEAVAEAIKFLVPFDGSCTMRRGNHSGWTDKGLAEIKWPKDFGKQERKLIRAIARAAITRA